MPAAHSEAGFKERTHDGQPGRPQRRPGRIVRNLLSAGRRPGAQSFSFATTALASLSTSFLQLLQQRKKVLPSAVTLMGTPISPKGSLLTGQTACLRAC